MPLHQAILEARMNLKPLVAEHDDHGEADQAVQVAGGAPHARHTAAHQEGHPPGTLGPCSPFKKPWHLLVGEKIAMGVTSNGGYKQLWS